MTRKDVRPNLIRYLATALATVSPAAALGQQTPQPPEPATSVAQPAAPAQSPTATQTREAAPAQQQTYRPITLQSLAAYRAPATPAWLQAASTQIPAAAKQPAAPTSRALPSPIDNPPFPMTDWTTLNTYPIGENWDATPSYLQHALFGNKLDNTHYRLTGWIDVGGELSSSWHSDFPETYMIIPNHIELDQLVIQASKMPDTVQKDHIDWGFLSSHLYGT